MANPSASVYSALDLQRARSRVNFDSASTNIRTDKDSPDPAVVPESPLVLLDPARASTASSKQFVSPDASLERAKFKKGFRDCLSADYSDYGMKSMAEVFVESWMDHGVFQVQLWLGEVYLENQSDPDTLMALLKVVMHMDPLDFAPMNRIVALASVSHDSLEVRECAVRCYEYWECKDFYPDLTSRTLEPAWLEQYKNSFIK